MDSVLQRAQHAAEKLTVRSALNPFLWLSAIFVPILLVASFCFNRAEGLRYLAPIFAYAAIAVLLVTILVGVGFAIFSPGRLQSEEYQLKHQALMMFQQMGAPPQLIDPSSVVAIANPTHEQPKVGETR